jgi:hypothetical protein
MKTWWDFDVRAIRQVVQEQLGADREWSEPLFDTFMDKATRALSVEVPCRSCGVCYPLNQLDHTCQPEDQWINAYVHSTHSAALRQTGFRPYIDLLQAKYPLLPEHRHLFRGLNFSTESAFSAFAASLGENVYETSSVTSWTTDASRAAQFARFMLPGGHPKGLRAQEIARMIDEQANMTGAFGVVLAMSVQPVQALCDISEARVGGFTESEVIVLPGVYPVTIHHIFVREAGTTTWPQIADAQCLSM